MMTAVRWFEILAQDLRVAARGLRKSPVATVTAVTTLALGVGLNTAIFSVVKSILLDRLPFRDPGRIVALTQTDSTNTHGDGVGGWMVHEWKARSRSFESISVYGDGQLTLVENGEPEVLRGMRVSADFFDTLSVGMQIGRAFLPGDDRPPGANVIVLSHDLWTRRFGADPGVVGRVLRLNAEPYRVIGVLRPDFRGLRMTNAAEIPQVFAPAAYDAGRAALCHDCFGGRVLGRLRSTATAQDARAELNAITRAIGREYPAEYGRGVSVGVQPLLDRLIGPTRTVLWLLLAAVALVLLIACANVASLQVARATSRSHEFAVRAALGGGRSRLAIQLLVENVLVAAIGGGAGILVGSIGTSVIVSLAPRELPRLDEIHVDVTVLLFALAISGLSGVVFGMAPAWLASRTDVNSALKRSTGVAGRSSPGTLRSAVVILDLALAFVLVTATGLLGKSFQNLSILDAGFDPHHVLTMTPVMSPDSPYIGRGGRLEYYRRLVEKAAAVPGVVAVGMVSNVPLSHAEPIQVRLEGQGSLAEAEVPTADVFWASGDYFRVLKIPLRRGRLLTDDDGIDAPPVVVSESFARVRFQGGDPIGHRIQLGDQQQNAPWSVIVGIVGDVRYDALDREPRQAIYQPQAMNPFHYTRLVARTIGDPWAFDRPIRAALREADPTLAVFHVQPMDDYVASSMADRSFALALTGLFGALALLLSTVGVYGLVSHSVVQRREEIGLRSALGATRSRLLVLILRRELMRALVGLSVGLLIAAGMSRLIAAFLFGVAPHDPGTLAGAAALLAGVAAFASYLPARAATRIEPLEALRSE